MDGVRTPKGVPPRSSPASRATAPVSSTARERPSSLPCEPDVEELLAAAARYGQEILDPPGK